MINYKTTKQRKKSKKCITKKLRKNNKTNVYGYKKISIMIDNEKKMNTYFDCYNINKTVRKICKEWFSSGKGCHLQIKSNFRGTIYLTKDKRYKFFNNHIHIFPLSNNSFSWCDKKTRNYGTLNDSTLIKNYINMFNKLLS